MSSTARQPLQVVDHVASELTAEIPVEKDRSGLGKDEMKRAFLDNLFYVQGKFPLLATRHDFYMALAYMVRDHLLHRWVSSAATYTARKARTVCYLSAEFLMGPHLGNNLVNLGIMQPVKQAVEELGLNFSELAAEEEEPGLGNGGLGRLAACYLDSLATLGIPSLGYGIRYEFGIFEQAIVEGRQVERTDKWLRLGNPWEIPRPEWAVEVRFGGTIQHFRDEYGRKQVRWAPARIVKGIPYDTPVVGYRCNTANTLRLWRAEAPEDFDVAIFNRGDYYGAVEKKVNSENLTKVLYPNDELIQGKRLRLEQQYFFVSCSLQDMIRIMRVQRIPMERFHEKFAVQLNDTHPSIAVAELMRLLVDEHGMAWEQAWTITRRTFAYTNHTLLPEALERWPLEIFGELLPRHLEIIFRINADLLEEVRRRYPGDEARAGRMSLIDECGGRHVRMAHLACVGSHAVNGVAELHSQLLKSRILRDFHELWPERFQNKTNGVTPRRWLCLSNPRLSALITEAIGPDWVTDLARLRGLEALADDRVFQARWRKVKRLNKHDFATFMRHVTGIGIDPESMFDVQVKRIHEYKRQHLAILQVIRMFLALKADPGATLAPRTFIFGGKAAPGYQMAKLIVELINAVGAAINRDKTIGGRLKVVFVPNYNVRTGQRVYPVAELSEQISMAGKEASGTGNMKFQMNGALTIGTLDGANIEIRREVGAENFFLFGLTAEQAEERLQRGYRPRELYGSDPELRDVIDLIAGGFFSRGDPGLFRPIVDNLLNNDPYLVLEDFRAYADCQDRVDATYRNTDEWTRMSILNVARSGKFSSDRAVAQYCREVWKVEPVDVTLVRQHRLMPRSVQ